MLIHIIYYKTEQGVVNMTYRTITYFSVSGYDEDGTPDIRVLRWKCEDEEEEIGATLAIHCQSAAASGQQ